MRPIDLCLLALVFLPGTLAHFLSRNAKKLGVDSARAMGIPSFSLMLPTLYVFASGLFGRLPFGEYRMLRFLVPLAPLWVAQFLLLCVLYLHIPQTPEGTTGKVTWSSFLFNQGRGTWFQIGGTGLVILFITAAQVNINLWRGDFSPREMPWISVSLMIMLALQYALAKLTVTLLRRRTIAPHDPAPPQLQEQLHSLVTTIGLQRPIDIVVAESPVAPIYVQGIKRPRIVVAANLANSASPSHLRALLAHELGHVIRGHLRTRVLLGSVPLPTAMIAMVLSLAALRVPLVWAMTATWVLLAAGLMGIFAILREQEYEADAFAAQLTGEPHHLVYALSQIEKTAGASTQRGSISSLFISHPPVQARALRLRVNPTA